MTFDGETFDSGTFNAEAPAAPVILPVSSGHSIRPQPVKREKKEVNIFDPKFAKAHGGGGIFNKK